MTARSTSLFSVVTEFDDAGLGGWELLSLPTEIQNLIISKTVQAQKLY